MLSIAYTHPSVVLDIFHYYMLQNKQSNRYLLELGGGGAGGAAAPFAFCWEG